MGYLILPCRPLSDSIQDTPKSEGGSIRGAFAPKVLANSSPGFALKPWGIGAHCFVATLKELRRILTINARRATPSELLLREMRRAFPGLRNLNPGLKLANAFSVSENAKIMWLVGVHLRN
jgi:hypothetical protein